MSEQQAECEEGRAITVRFGFPPQLRIMGDLQATTEVVVQTALAYAVASFGEFQRYAVDAVHVPPVTAWDRQAAEMFTQMTAADLIHFFEAVQPQ